MREISWFSEIRANRQNYERHIDRIKDNLQGLSPEESRESELSEIRSERSPGDAKSYGDHNIIFAISSFTRDSMIPAKIDFWNRYSRQLPFFLSSPGVNRKGGDDGQPSKPLPFNDVLNSFSRHSPVDAHTIKALEESSEQSSLTSSTFNYKYPSHA